MIERIADGRTDLVVDLLAGGAPAAAKDEHGVSLIQWCAYHGDVAAIRYLLSNGEQLDSLGDNLDLNGAVLHGHASLVEFLIENGADVNHPLPDSGEAPLHAVLCKIGRPEFDEILELLLDAGANPNVATKHGVETGAFMRDVRTKGETPLHRAAAFGSERAITLLIERGAIVDARDMHGDTPLAWASWHLRPRQILNLLGYGRLNRPEFPGGFGSWETRSHGKEEQVLAGSPGASSTPRLRRRGTAHVAMGGDHIGSGEDRVQGRDAA